MSRVKFEKELSRSWNETPHIQRKYHPREGKTNDVPSKVLLTSTINKLFRDLSKTFGHALVLGISALLKGREREKPTTFPDSCCHFPGTKEAKNRSSSHGMFVCLLLEVIDAPLPTMITNKSGRSSLSFGSSGPPLADAGTC